jgi:hypothetical protein
MKEKLAPLKKKADSVFSLYIRIRDGGRCIACGKVGEIKNMQAGHYITRKCLHLRYDEKNVHCQCYACNCMLHGDLITYRERLLDRYGEDVVTYLEEARHVSARYTASDYHKLIEIYKAKLREMEAI